MPQEPRKLICDGCGAISIEKELGDGFPDWGGMKYVNCAVDGSGSRALPWGALLGVLADNKEPRLCPACMKKIVNYIVKGLPELPAQ